MELKKAEPPMAICDEERVAEMVGEFLPKELVMVQVTFCPAERVRLLPTSEPPVHDQALAL